MTSLSKFWYRHIAYYGIAWKCLLNELADIPTSVLSPCILLPYHAANLRLHYNEFTGDMPDEICAMGGFHGVGVNISADCAKPNAEVNCKYYYCCDFCYY